MIGVIAGVSGCARWPNGPGPGPGTDYQLEITVEVAGTIDSYDGIYYIVLDADGNSATGPGYDILLWDDRFYYVKLENGFFSFAQKEEGSSELYLSDSLISGNKIQVTIALSDVGAPNSIDVNVLTTDSDNNTYDYLDPYFTIYTDLGSSRNITDIASDSGDGEADFDIINVTAEIITL